MRRCAVLLLAVCVTRSLASTTFYAMGDWGGQENAPYTTPAEIKVGTRIPAVVVAVHCVPISYLSSWLCRLPPQ